MTPLYLAGNTQASFAISGTAAQSSALVNGVYDLWADCECFIKVATTATGVTTANGYILYSGNVVTLQIDADYKIGAITSGASGTLRLHKVG